MKFPFSSRAYDLTIDKSIYTLDIRHALVDRTFVRLWGEWQMNASRGSFLLFYFFKRATRLSAIKLAAILSLPKSFNKCFVSWLLAEQRPWTFKDSPSVPNLRGRATTAQPTGAKRNEKYVVQGLSINAAEICCGDRKEILKKNIYNTKYNNIKMY